MNKLILREVKPYDEALDALLEQLVSGAKIDIHRAQLLLKAVSVKKELLKISFDITMAKPQLATIIEAEKPRKEIASKREWNGAAPQLAPRKNAAPKTGTANSG